MFQYVVTGDRLRHYKSSEGKFYIGDNQYRVNG